VRTFWFEANDPWLVIFHWYEGRQAQRTVRGKPANRFPWCFDTAALLETARMQSRLTYALHWMLFAAGKRRHPRRIAWPTYGPLIASKLRKVTRGFITSTTRVFGWRRLLSLVCCWVPFQCQMTHHGYSKFGFGLAKPASGFLIKPSPFWAHTITPPQKMQLSYDET